MDVAHVGLLVGGDLLAKPIDLRQKEHMVKQFNYMCFYSFHNKNWRQKERCGESSRRH